MATPLARYGTHVLFQAVAEGGVLLDTRAETYFGLNAVGARVCELLPDHETVESLCDVLGDEYPEVAAEQLRTDVEELLEALAGHGLLERAGAERGAGADAANPTP
jgi:hypothetical protein